MTDRGADLVARIGAHLLVGVFATLLIRSTRAWWVGAATFGLHELADPLIADGLTELGF